MFMWNSVDYIILPDTSGYILPAPPAFTYSFLSTNGLIGVTRHDTLVNVIAWSRANLRHFSGGFDTANWVDQWQYRGFPPMTRVINGTVGTTRVGDYLAARPGGSLGTFAGAGYFISSVERPAFTYFGRGP